MRADHVLTRRRRTAQTTCIAGTRCGRCWPSCFAIRGSSRSSCTRSPKPSSPTSRSPSRAPPSQTRRCIAVLDRSEGNAYFAEELLESGPDAAALPVSLADVLRNRLEQTDPAVQQLARIASVAGRRVGDRLLRAVADAGPGRSPRPGAVDAAVREAVAHQLLVGEGPTRATTSRSGTPCSRRWCNADLLPSERAGLHRAYLRTLSADASPRLARRARAPRTEQPRRRRRARASRTRPRDEAAEVLAPAEELRHLESVLELWDAVPDAAESIAGRPGSTCRSARRRRQSRRSAVPRREPCPGRPRRRERRTTSSASPPPRRSS